MTYSRDDLRAAIAAGVLTPAQFANLTLFLDARGSSPIAVPRFDLVNLLWYAGALIVMSAMGLFSTLAFSALGGGALTGIAMIYALVFTLAGRRLWLRPELRTPAGLLIAVAVSMAPLAVYGIQDATGSWTQFGKPAQIRDFYIWIKGSFIFMEMAAIAAAALALRFYRFPFIVMIAAIAMWFMSMDLAPWIADSSNADFETRRRVTVWFGFGMVILAMVVNGRQRREDFAFWLYLFGVLTFWGGITASAESTPFAQALYALMNIGFLGLAVFLDRRVFALFGTIGLALYLGDLSRKVFGDSMLFPFALSLIGVGIIALGLWLHRHQNALRAWMDGVLPAPLRALRPRSN